MHIKLLKTFILFCIIIQINYQSISLVYAQPDKLTILHQKIVKLYHAGNYNQAVKLALRYIEGTKRKYGIKNTKYAQSLKILAYVYEKQGRYKKVETLLKKIPRICEKAVGSIHPITGASWDALADFYKKRGNYKKAVLSSKKSLAISEQFYGKSHSSTGISLNNLATIYVAQGHYVEAIKFSKRALSIIEKTVGVSHPDTAVFIENLGVAYSKQGHIDKAKKLLKRALRIREKKLGANDQSTADTLNNIAKAYEKEGRFDKAVLLHKRTLAIRKKAYGAEHEFTGVSLENLASVYAKQGRYDEALKLHKRVLTIRKKIFGIEHHEVGTSLNNLASVYSSQGNYHEAVKLHKRALSIRTKTLGTEHYLVGHSLNNLALNYNLLGRFDQALQLYKRAFSVRTKFLNEENPIIGDSLNNIATVYGSLGKYDKAVQHYKRALTIQEKNLGSDHFKTGNILNNLAQAYVNLGRYQEATRLHKRALSIYKKTYGAEHHRISDSMNNIALALMYSDKDDEAETFFKQAIAINKKDRGIHHPITAKYLNNIALLYRKIGKFNKAYQYYKQSTKIYLKRSAVSHLDYDVKSRDQNRKEIEKNKWVFIGQVSASYSLAKQLPNNFSRLRQETFKMAQWALGTEAAKALRQMAARTGSKNTHLANLIRKQQDKIYEWHSIDRKMVTAASKTKKERNKIIEAKWSDQLEKIDELITNISERLKNNFPEYTSLVTPEPITLEIAQQLLKPNEALVSFLLAEDESYAWVLTKNNEPAWVKLPLGYREISNKVQALRCGLDGSSWKKPENTNKCQKLLNVTYSYKDYKASEPLPFSLDVAHDLYEVLFSQVKELIKDKHLLIVSDGALTSLPFQVLIAQKPAKSFVTDQNEYSQVATWLGKQHAITVLPSVPSLKVLRDKRQQTKNTTKSYIGFGNPLLAGKDGKDKRAWDKQKCLKNNLSSKFQLPRADSSLPALRSFYRGTRANINTLKQQFPIPETADELCAVAQSLGASESNIYLGKNATESKIKSLNSNNLKDFRYIHFATHGLLSGELEFQAEPALIFTPPDNATEKDDGLLTASEVANLKLNADWIILSACNTAAGKTIGAEPFSGLARAFFYAGANALLVSHWAVNSNATVKLITKSFDSLRQNPQIGRSEALRQSMINLMNDTSHPLNHHPSTWAPFVVVGEGSNIEKITIKSPVILNHDIAFKVYETRDMIGGDLRTYNNITKETCISRCNQSVDCQGLTYDKWNKYCFLKNDLPNQLIINPRSVSILKDSTKSIPTSEQSITMERFRKKTFSNIPYKLIKTKSYNQCETMCKNDSRCDAYSFDHTESDCHFITTPTEYFSNPNIDSGAKRQRIN